MLTLTLSSLLKILEFISHLKRELLDDQAKFSSSLVKKLTSETNLSFKFSGNKKQFEFNTQTLEYFSQIFAFVQSLNPSSILRTRKTKKSQG